MLFKPLDITSSNITFDGQTCQNVVFMSEEADAALYFQEHFQVNPHDLQITEKSIQIVRTNCRLPGFSEYIRLRDRRLVVTIQGVLFIFEPTVTY